jgi:mRNA interferase MazF
VARYVPCKGDIVTLAFRPEAGHEQHGRRPALVVSNDLFNRATGFSLVCPITRTERANPFHVPIPPGGRVTGVVLADQLRSVDHGARGVRRLGQAPSGLLDDVLAIVDAVIF